MLQGGLSREVQQVLKVLQGGHTAQEDGPHRSDLPAPKGQKCAGEQSWFRGFSSSPEGT